MLSILIPTYNQNVSKLVTDLHHQATEQYVDFEIIVMEDGSVSNVEENADACNLEFCKHIVLENNVGRSSTRNKLADAAQYEHLLFMDCDAEIYSEYYVEKYLAFCHEECIVVGGTSYSPDENNPDYSLRLKYGRVREARTAVERVKNNFATFNFMISKSIFNRVRFDETIRGYGHEDMLFGHQLQLLGYEFIQIENPLIHKGLDDNLTFIRKTQEGTRNLYLLYKTGRYPFLVNESKLLHAYCIIDRMCLTRLMAAKYNFIHTWLEHELCKPSPSLLLYDLYKLLFLCKTSLIK